MLLRCNGDLRNQKEGDLFTNKMSVDERAVVSKTGKAG